MTAIKARNSATSVGVSHHASQYAAGAKLRYHAPRIAQSKPPSRCISMRRLLMLLSYQSSTRMGLVLFRAICA